MSLLEYFHIHWIQAVVCILLAYSLLSTVLLTVRVVARGWPPAHAVKLGDETDDEEAA